MTDVSKLAEEAQALGRKYGYEQRTAANAHEAMLSYVTLGQLYAAIDALAALAQAQAAQPVGWKLVPVEPTEAMWTAGRDPVMHRDLGHKPPIFPGDPYHAWQLNPKTKQLETDTSKGTTAVHVWRAMIAASPAPGLEEAK